MQEIEVFNQEDPYAIPACGCTTVGRIDANTIKVYFANGGYILLVSETPITALLKPDEEE